MERRRKVIKELFSLSTEGLSGREAEAALEKIKEMELGWWTDAESKVQYQTFVKSRLEGLYQ